MESNDIQPMTDGHVYRVVVEGSVITLMRDGMVYCQMRGYRPGAAMGGDRILEDALAWLLVNDEDGVDKEFFDDHTPEYRAFVNSDEATVLMLELRYDLGMEDDE